MGVDVSGIEEGDAGRGGLYRWNCADRRGRSFELLKELNPILGDPNATFPPQDAPPGYLTRIRIDKVGGLGAWVA